MLCIVDPQKKIFGTYIHGLLDTPEIVVRLLEWFSDFSFKVPSSFKEIEEQELDSIAEFIEEHCEVEKLLGI